MLGLADGAQAQTAANLYIEVEDAYEGEDIKLTLRLTVARGNVAAALRTFTVRTVAPSSGDVTSCISASTGECPAGSTAAVSSDFTATNTNVVFGPTDTVKTVSIPTATDATSEGTEVVKIEVELAPSANTNIVNAGGRSGFPSNASVVNFSTYLFYPTFGLIRNGARPGPAKPTGLTATPGNGQVTLSWDNPSNGSITKWQYRYVTGATTTSWTDVPSSGASTTSHTVTTLTNGTEYDFQVRAVSAAGDGASSDVVRATPTAPKPAKPTGFEAAPGSGTVALSWDNPSDSSITRWEYRQKTSGSYGVWTTMSHGATTTSHTVTGLTNGTAYTFQIRAVNANGNGAESDEVTATPGAPAKPTGLTATPGNRSVTLSWTDPGDSSITGWQGRYKSASGVFGIWNNISGSTATTTSTTYTSLPNGEEHTFQVRAVNAHGNGAESDEVTATPTADSTAPTVSSIVRHSPTAEVTTVDTVTWRVTFDEEVRNVDAADFVLSVNANVAIAYPNASLAVSRHGSTNAWDVTASGPGLEQANAHLHLLFASGHDIEDTAGNALAASPTVSGTNQNHYQIDNTPPRVATITRQSPSSSPTDADSVTWRVQFDDNNIRNVDAADFTVTGTGTGTTATVTGVTKVADAIRDTFDVTVSGGNLASFEGTVTLGFASNHDIRDEAGNPLTDYTPITTNDNTFVIENAVKVFFTRSDHSVREGDELEVEVRLSRSLPTATTVTVSATPLTATGNGIDYHGQTFTVTIPRILRRAKLKIRTVADTVKGEPDETFRLDFRSDLLPAGVAEGTPATAYVTITPPLSEVPGLVFDRTHLHWNESDGCAALPSNPYQANRILRDGNAPGPSYRVKLRTRPSSRVEINVDDPNALTAWRNGGPTLKRVFAGDGPHPDTTRGGIKPPVPELVFTPQNWDQWQTVKTYVVCAAHPREAVPLRHRVTHHGLGYVSGTHVAYGKVGEAWYVHVHVKESDPPVEVLDLPPEGERIVLPVGAHRDFRIRVDDQVLPDGGNGRLEVDVAAWTRDGPASAGRRDGTARRCGTFSDCMVFTATDREQWVRLSGDSEGDSRLFIRFYRLNWGGSTNWKMEWPVTVGDPPQDAPPAGVPTEAVTNLQVTATDATSAGVTWDAVEHATSYDVSWDLADGGGQSAGGGSESVTGTSATIQHDATAAMTLTVRVTPEHVDGNGDTVRLDALAATAELAVGPGTTEVGVGADGVSDGSRGIEADVANGSVTVDVPADWAGRGRPQVTGGAHRLSGWSGLGFDFQGLGSPPGTVTVSWSSRPAGDVTLPLEWQPVAGADWRHSDGGPIGKFEVDIIDPLPQQPEQPQQPPPIPEVTVSGGGGVTEGASASFTVTANPAPASPVEVTLTVGQDGDFAASGETGTRTVTVPATGSVNVDIPTVDDGQDEPDGSITVSVDSCDGCTVGAASTHTVSVADNDVAPALPELSLAAGAAVDEGTAAGFTVTASPAPQADVTVAYTVAQTGDVLAAPGAGQRTVTLAAGQASVALAVATDDDAVNEPDGSVTVTLDAGTGYTVAAGAASGAVTVRDDDVPVVGVTAGSGVTEGTAASFTVTASPTPHAALDVALTVTQDGDFAASGETGARTVTVPTSGSVTLEVPTVDDTADEPDGSVTATVGAGTGYTVAAAPANAATVEVSDDDAAAGVPTVSVADVSGKESDRFLWFTVRLSRPSDRHVTVYLKTRDSTPVSAEALRDYIPYRNRTEYFRPGETEKRVPVYVFDDSHDEGSETFELVLTDVWTTGRAQGGVTIADGVAVGTIVNDDPMPAAWLARFGRTAAEQALDGIAGRMAAPRTAGVQGAIAGQAVNFDPGSGSPGSQSGAGGGPGGAANDPGSLSGAGALPGGSSDNGLSMAQSSIARAFGAGNGGFGSGPGQAFGSGHDSLGFGTDSSGPQSRSMTAREALLGSSFTATGEKDSSGGSLAFWGRAAQSRFDGREGTFSLDGEATAAMLGADYARDRWLVGLALMQTSGEGGYADTGSGPQGCPEGVEPEMAHLCNGAVREGDGKVEASLTAAVPYGAWQASERLKLWGAAGYGTGEVTLKPDMGGSYKADITWTMAALGLRGDVIAPPAEGSGPALAVTSDALWARTSSDKTHDLAASESDVTRLRLGLEGSYRVALEEGGSVTPKLEVGARHDGGDAETGFGVELGGGLAWNDPALGLTLDLSGRTLIAHGNDDLKDRGYSASLAWDPDPATKRGPSFSLTQDWGGQAKGGLDALFTPETIDRRSGGGEPTARWQAEAAYGLPAFGGRWTGSPHAGLGLATGARDYSLGWRLTPAANANAPDLSFGLKATRRENDGTVPEHTVGFEVNARW